jgi:hypothetical protein
MPSAEKVHRYWTLERPQDAYEWFDQIDAGEPTCYACGWYPMTKDQGYNGFQRGHLIDHAHGGSSDASNLVLLCSMCNATMPVSRPGQEDQAIAWVRHQPSWMPAAAVKAQAVLGYVNEHGQLPPWLTQTVDGLDPDVLALLQDSLANYLAHRESA